MNRGRYLLLAACVGGILFGRFFWQPSGRYQFISTSRGSAVVLDTRTGDMWVWDIGSSFYAGKAWRPFVGKVIPAGVEGSTVSEVVQSKRKRAWTRTKFRFATSA